MYEPTSTWLTEQLLTGLAIDVAQPVMTLTDGSLFDGGLCLSDGDRDKLKSLGGCPSDTTGPTGNPCYKRLELNAAGDTHTLSSDDDPNNCIYLIHAPGLLVSVEAIRFAVRVSMTFVHTIQSHGFFVFSLLQVPSPGRVVYFEGATADIDSQVGEYYDTNYPPRQTFVEEFIIDLNDVESGSDYEIVLNAMEQPASKCV